MKRTLISDTINYLNKEVMISGWIHSRRDHGKIIFIDLRDATGIIQAVFVPGSKAYNLIKNSRTEWVISLTGLIKERPEKLINKNIATGTIEMDAKEAEIHNDSKTIPFEIDKDTKNIDEELRLKYRYLDLRSQRMANNITLRHNVIKFVRQYLWDLDFREIETPYLTKSTPEGAREYLVPSRLYPGKFYVLPQSPQQFKQLLMVGGIEKYFQIARCFRDEDQRGDRQPEFTQLDIEISFANQDEILKLIEDLMIKMVQKVTPDMTICQTPFPKISYDEAINKYGSDKPDLRKNKADQTELAFAWIVDMPLFKYSKSDKKLVSSHHPFTMPKKEDIDKLDTNPKDAKACAYDLVLNGFEIAGGSIRIHKRDIQEQIFKILGIKEEEKIRRFGHILDAFEYGAPPHGGIASGIDRLCAILAKEKVIREVIAFPKSGDARDIMMGAPSQVTKRQLDDVHIELDKEGKINILKTADTNIEE